MPQERAGARIAGRPPNRFIQFYEPTRSKAAKAEIAAIWRAEIRERYKPGVPLAIEIASGFPRPSGHYGARGNVLARHLDARPKSLGGTNADGERTGGDVDNLSKLVFDALNGVAFTDDGQVVRLVSEKWYFDQLGWSQPGTEIVLAPR